MTYRLVSQGTSKFPVDTVVATAANLDEALRLQLRFSRRAVPTVLVTD